MSLLRWNRLPATAIACAIVLAAASSCSSSQPSGETESGNPDAASSTDAAAAPLSNADQVGSVPEDMLADEKGVEATGSSPNPEATAADPFGDLKEKKEETASTDVPEESDPLKAATEEKSNNNAGSGKIEKYTVKAGDTLMKIAFQIYGDVDRWKDLHELNQEALKGGNALRKGMKLRYDAPVESFTPEQLAHSYEIKKGDTLAGIADDVYGKRAKYKKLQSYNAKLIKNPNKIFAGFTIYYDITEQEMAEAEARKAQKAAGGGSPASAKPAAVPSAISPPPAAPAPNVASDASAVPGPGAAQQGPPLPTQQ